MRVPLTLAVCTLIACGDRTLPPRGQVVMHVDSDAPASLFDRLRVEVTLPGDALPCATCTRELAVDGTLFASGRASFGVVPAPGRADGVVHVRLFRSGGTLSGEPRAGSTLEAFVRLPPVADEGIVDATVVLHVDDLGHPLGDATSPIDAERGTPPHVAEWAPAKTVPCTGDAQPGETCFPGGAYWMGDPRLDLAGNTDSDGRLERIVVVSPFFLDDHEVTVAEFRAGGAARLNPSGTTSEDPKERSAGFEECLYTLTPGANERLPVNCVSWTLAKFHCGARGKRLPREVEWEWAAGGRAAQPFPWGTDAPACGDAVFAREDECKAKGAGPQSAGSGARDPHDLAGNVEEWMEDRWNQDDEPCWGLGVFHDPVCRTASTRDPDGRSIRGGDWKSSAPFLRAAVRSHVTDEKYGVNEVVGFRCARN